MGYDEASATSNAGTKKLRNLALDCFDLTTDATTSESFNSILFRKLETMWEETEIIKRYYFNSSRVFNKISEAEPSGKDEHICYLDGPSLIGKIAVWPSQRLLNHLYRSSGSSVGNCAPSPSYIGASPYLYRFELASPRPSQTPS